MDTPVATTPGYFGSDSIKNASDPDSQLLMTILACVLAIIAAVITLLAIYAIYYKRKTSRSAKVRRENKILQPSDDAFHTPIQMNGVTVPTPYQWSQPSPLGNTSDSPCTLVSSRPRNASVDATYANSGITLKAEILDKSAFKNKKIKRKTRMRKEIAQAIAASVHKLQESYKKPDCDDSVDLSSNMEVVYGERTAV